jgi:hypothetical protein
MKSWLVIVLGTALIASCSGGSANSSAGSANSSAGSANSSATGAAGIAVSTARFAVVGTYLYTVTEDTLLVFDISVPEQPEPISSVSIGFGIETIFSAKEHLFIGSTTGMFIYDLNHPDEPLQISSLSHRVSCDPVVVQGDYAYVTLRGGGFCRGMSNQLDVIDISDLHNPRLIKSHLLNAPEGLAINDDKLLICDGAAGLKLFDAADPVEVELVSVHPTVCHDVILRNDHVFATGPGGITQYDVSDWQFEELSRLNEWSFHDSPEEALP